ncbi:hypothetical protein ACROYT_G027495 [Oculina patagonica]
MTDLTVFERAKKVTIKLIYWGSLRVSVSAMAEDQASLRSEGKLDFDDETLRAIAQVYLDEGNTEYKKKETYNAIYFYTEGIQVNCKDDNLNAKLYSNRATAHFRLGNYQEALNDATAAVELEPTFIKVIERGANACVQLQRYKEAMAWCEKGLAIYKNCKALQDLWNRCFSEQNTTQDAKPQETKSMPDTHNLKCKKRKEELSYGHVGNAYFNLGDFLTAIDFYERDLKIAKEVGDKLREGTACCELGEAYYRLGDFKTAIDYFKSVLKIAKEVGDKAVEGGAYGNLGNAYHNLGDFKRGIDYHERDLKIAKEVGDKAGEGKAYGHLGNAYNNLGDFKTAIDYYERQLKASKEVGDKSAEGTAYGHLGTVYCDIGNFKTAIEYHERHLKIAKGVENKAGQGMAYGNLGNAFHSLGDFNKALDYHKKHLTIVKELGDKVGEGKVYCNLGNANYSLGDFKTAIDLHEHSLKFAKEVGDTVGEGRAYCNLGNAYHSLGDFKTAVDYHKLHLKIAKEVGYKAGEGKAYGNLGNAYDSLGDFKTAVDYHKLHLKIAKEVGDKVGEGNAYGNLGNAYENLGDFKTAIACNTHQLKIAKEVGDKDGEGRAYGNLGNAYRRLGDYNTAIDYHNKHLKIVKELGDKAVEGKIYHCFGNVYYCLGDFKTAVEFYERALNFAKEIGDKAEEGRAYGCLGNAHHSLGDFKTAVDYHERDLKIAKEVGDKAGEGGAYGNLGNAYGSLGDYKTACDYHERNLKCAKEVGDKAGEGRAYGNLGVAYKNMGDLKTAIACYERHLKIDKEVGDKAGEGRACGNIGIVFCDLGDFESAATYHKRHLTIATEIGDKAAEGGAHCNLGNVYHRLGDFTTAITYYESGLNIANEVGDKAGVARSLYCLGTSFESQGSLPRALDCFHSSVEMFKDIRHHLLFKDEWKISYRDMHKTAYTSLWRILLKQGKVVEALFAADQGRAQALNDLMELNYEFETASISSHTPENGPYDSFSFLPPNTVFIATGKREIVFWVLQKENDVEVRRKEIVNNSLPDLDKFLQSLNVNASEEIGARAAVNCENRSLDKLEDELANERSPQTRPNSVPLQTTALRTFYDFIIGPIADLVQGGELVLVPDGPLCLAPYSAFVNPDSKFLCESFRIRVIPSLASLKLIVDCPDDYHSKTGVLLVGDPWVQEVLCHGKILEQLPWARKEVEMIGRILNTAPLIGREATKDEVLKRISSVALVHIAAHGRMETGEIALAPNTTKTSQICGEEDFLLTMRDVMSVQIRARLVVLSCCHSARGEIKAEGVVGIARAFLAAGARSVLVSLWAIDDEATLEFMKSFYSYVEKGRSASESLNLAMKCMRESDEFSEMSSNLRNLNIASTVLDLDPDSFL